MGIAIIRWRDRSIEETAQRIYRAEAPFDESNLPPILATVAPDVQEYLDTTVAEDKVYYYRISSYRAEPELEVFSEQIEINTEFSLGPGSSTLVGGTATMGFFGEVPTTQLINGNGLAALVGLTAGVAQNNTQPWLKFVLDGRILYVAKTPYRHSLSWDDLDARDLVFGPKLIEIDGYQYSVRLLKGADEDPYTGSTGTDPAGTHNSEWTRLFAPISAVDFPSYTGPKLASYSDAELGFGGSLNGRNTLCQERSSANNRLVRGGSGASSLGWVTSTNANVYYGWRPCLELVV